MSGGDDSAAMQPRNRVQRGLQAFREAAARWWGWATRHLAELAVGVASVGIASWLLPLARVAPQPDVLPAGVLTLQFVGTRSNALALRQALQADPALQGQVLAALHWDFLLIAFYAALLTWLVLQARRQGFGGEAPRAVHRFARWAPLLAGVCDLLENAGILGIVQGSGGGLFGLLAGFTTLAATLKWTFLLYTGGYLLAWAGRLLPRPAPAPAADTDAGAAVPGSDNAALQHVEQLAGEYDHLRDTLPSGPDRTRRMSGVMAEMASHADAVAPYLGRLTESGSAGERLAAVAALQGIVAPYYVPWLLARLVQERPFIAFHAAVALLALLPRLAPDQRDRVKQQVQAARDELAGKGLTDPERDAVMERILVT